METILAARSEFSLGEAILDTKYIVEQAKAVGATAAALTDTMTVSSMVNFTNDAVKAEIKPIIGVRVRVTDDPSWRPSAGEKKRHMPRAYFLSLYARTEEGMKAIYRLLSMGNREPYFYYEAKVGFDDVMLSFAHIRTIWSSSMTL